MDVFETLGRSARLTRGWGDCYGHLLVATGRADVMVDPLLNPWDAAASELLVREAGGECRVHRQDNGKLGLILGSPALVAQLCGFLD